MGGTDSKHNGRGSRAAFKSNFLSAKGEKNTGFKDLLKPKWKMTK